MIFHESNYLELAILQGEEEHELARVKLNRIFFNLWIDSTERKIKKFFKKMFKKRYSKDIVNMLRAADTITIYSYEIDARPKHYIVIENEKFNKSFPVNIKQKQIFFFISMFAPDEDRRIDHD